MQETKPPANQPTSPGSLVPEVVNDIPLAAQGVELKSADDDKELDKIMADVGHDIKQIGNQKAKRHLFSRGSDPKPPKAAKKEAKFTARPIDQVKAPIKPATTRAPQPTQTKAKPVAQAQVKSVEASRAPIGIIFLALVVTGALVAAAYYAYK